MKKVKYLYVLVCWLAVATAIGQEKEQDAGLWLNVSFTPKMSDEKWLMTYSVEYRNKENFSKTSLWSGMANFYYKFSPYLRLGAGYEVFLNKHSDGTYHPECRYYPAILIPYQKKLLSGSFRSYLMNTFTRWGCRIGNGATE